MKRDERKESLRVRLPQLLRRWSKEKCVFWATTLGPQIQALPLPTLLCAL